MSAYIKQRTTASVHKKLTMYDRVAIQNLSRKKLIQFESDIYAMTALVYYKSNHETFRFSEAPLARNVQYLVYMFIF